MKNFWKTVLAVIVGTLIVSVISLMLFSGFISALSTGDTKPVLPKSAVLDINLSELTITERSSEPSLVASLQNIQTGNRSTIGIWKAVQAINAAAEDPSISYIFLRPDQFDVDIANLQELRKALSNFRASGKPVIAYTENATSGAYYIASVADKVYMTSYPGATTMFQGVSSQMFFLKDILDKLGIKMQLIRHGKYKAAGEMFIRNSASEENMEQNQVLIDAIWNAYASEMAESRRISVDDINNAIDQLRLCFPEDFVQAGLIDELLTREQLQEKIASFAVAEKFSDVNFVSLSDYAEVKVVPGKSSKKIAVIYADGEIVDGTGTEEVAGQRFASIIAKVREDRNIKAVVLRVNSPGGSVLGSDRIKSQLDLLKAEKPLIASFGGYAASGGYWISNNCNKIFADATTVTGSIGVFSMIPDFSGFINKKLLVNITSVNSNKHGDLYTGFRPLDNDEQLYLQRSVEDIYERFTSIVAEGRGLERDYVNEIGQGRVWSGADALKIGLVDELGTLEDALRYAATCAEDSDLSCWTIEEFPKAVSQTDQLMELFGMKKPGEENIFAGTSLEHTAKVFLDWKHDYRDGINTVFARLPYDIEIR